VKKKRRLAHRRGNDTKLHVWWPMAVQLVAMLVAVVGLYYGLTQKQAVQAALFEERTSNLRGQLDTLQRNMEGLERYIVDLHRQNERTR